MDSVEDGLNNLKLNEEKTFDTTNSFYQLLEKQAKDFELFGQRLKSEVQNSYHELVKLQQERSIKSTSQESQTTNHEVVTTDFQKSQQIIAEMTKLSSSQSELIESLKARVEELEIESIVKSQDIKNLRQDIKNFLEFNKLQIKKSDPKGKSIDIDIVNENENENCDFITKDYEGVNWADSICDEIEISSLGYNSENENLVNSSKSSKSTHAESSNSGSNSSNHFPSQINIHINIHKKIQEIITRRENLGKDVTMKNLRSLTREFTSNDLIQYTKSGDYNSLNDNIKGVINQFLINKLSNENLNLEDRIHVKVQGIIARRENFDKKVRERHFKILARDFTRNDLLQYTKSENYKSLNDNIKRMLNNSFIKRWVNEGDSNQENKTNETKNENKSVQRIHVKVQEIIIRRENLGKTVKMRNLRFLTRDYTSNDLIQYTRSGKFNLLNKKIKKIIRSLINSSTTTTNTLNTSNTSNNSYNSYNSYTFSSQINVQENIENIPILENLHSQIQQIVTQKDQLGCRVRLKHFKALEVFFTINDFIQYTRTNQFISLDNNSKRLMDLLIFEILTREFKQPNVTLSQHLDEYVNRGVIPELPSGYNNYTMYKESEMFNKLNKILKERVQKLIKLEKRLDSQEQIEQIEQINVKPSKAKKRKNKSKIAENLLSLEIQGFKIL